MTDMRWTSTRGSSSENCDQSLGAAASLWLLLPANHLDGAERKPQRDGRRLLCGVMELFAASCKHQLLQPQHTETCAGFSPCFLVLRAQCHLFFMALSSRTSSPDFINLLFWSPFVKPLAVLLLDCLKKMFRLQVSGADYANCQLQQHFALIFQDVYLCNF